MKVLLLAWYAPADLLSLSFVDSSISKFSPTQPRLTGRKARR